MSKIDLWLKNGYVLKILSSYIIASNWTITILCDAYKIVFQNTFPEPLLIFWTLFSFSPALIINGWHVGVTSINGNTIPIVEENKTNG